MTDEEFESWCRSFESRYKILLEIHSNKDKWLQWCEALESGKYSQGRGSLCPRTNPMLHCCLGVLCEISGMTNWLNTNLAPPQSVQNWLGISGADPLLIERDGFKYSFAGANDDLKLSFRQIAWIIRRAIERAEDAGWI